MAIDILVRTCRAAWRPLGKTAAGLIVLLACLLGAAAPSLAEPEAGKSSPALQRRIDAAMERQDEMVARALEKLAPQRPGVRDVYFVGVAGWGDQNVFRKEVRAVRAMFERDFGARDRAVSLVNNPETMNQVPLATRETIEAVLMGVGEIMDPEEDILFMFLTSHGVEWGGFSLHFNGQNLGGLRTGQLARMLGAARIRNRVVVVSACYSGQFVPALAEESTLLITAAASDRTSFGCTSTAEWTWFGRAFFRDALPKHRRFEPAFEEAKARVEAREKKENYTHSVPQIRVGEKIRAVLDEMGL